MPLVPLIALLFHRTAMEDRFLGEGLDGYDDYSRNVRFRLVPGLW
ncbi:hypothetical protein [Tautonia sociabilis]|nr:hypothetical protein [Tautonia sociabilis]